MLRILNSVEWNKSNLKYCGVNAISEELLNKEIWECYIHISLLHRGFLGLFTNYTILSKQLFPNEF